MVSNKNMVCKQKNVFTLNYDLGLYCIGLNLKRRDELDFQSITVEFYASYLDVML